MDRNRLTIQSFKGPYQARFTPPFSGLTTGLSEGEHLIIDAKVARLYSGILSKALASPSVLKIEATEANKSLERIPDYIESLIRQGIKRGHTLVAVGGGILQDIVAFLAGVLFRGVPWKFYPTTLLAQADSCIGAKSSINVKGFKNQAGTFTPPLEIFIAPEVLETLEEGDLRSGIGEMIKVHLISGEADFQRINKDYPRLKHDKEIMVKTIRRSLEIKKELIEKDEFDRKERLVLNYGHSFGHAMESATNYAIPHGIAITIGVDMAHYVSAAFGLMSKEEYRRLHPLLKRNYSGFDKVSIPLEEFLNSLSKDKKNIGKDLTLVLTKGPGRVFRDRYPNDPHFHNLCKNYFEQLKQEAI